jgi:phosphorylase kinase alpha/beta subunit
LTEFFTRHRHRFLDVIQDPSLAKVRGNRPHVRFNGEALTELPEKWSHHQNDALGYFVWLYSKLALAGEFMPDASNLETLALFPRYFDAIQYWQDADSGHWEEPPKKIAASSVGAVLAGLRQMKLWLGGCPDATREIMAQGTEERLQKLISHGAAALKAILPWESRDSQLSHARQQDAALLFLIYPLEIVDDCQAEHIVHNVINHLQGEYGIKRYLGDSFYCTNYESNLRESDLTRDFGDDIGSRDSFFVAGGEAQWCLFDPILSIYYGLSFRRTHDALEFLKQTEYLNRSLGQITGSNGRYGEFQCPELYYLERGQCQTSRSTPLLWTQANLSIALKIMAENLHL